MPDFTVTTGATPINVTVNSGVALEGANVYNFVTYGAVGDGATDDTVAIQSAITACETAGSGTLYAPPGLDYLVSGVGMIVRNTSDSEQIVWSAYGARFFRNEDPDPGVTTGAPILTIGATGENCIHVEVRGGIYDFSWNGAAHTDGGDSFSKEQWLVAGSDCIKTINMRHSSVNDTVCRYGRTGINLTADGTRAYRGTGVLTTVGASTVYTVDSGEGDLTSGDSFLIHYATTDADDDTQFATMQADTAAVITDITGTAVTTDFDSSVGMTAGDMDAVWWVSSVGGRGSVYNTFASNRIVNCYTGYGLESLANGAWVNENSFTGGSVAYGEDISNYSTNAADGRGIRMSPYTYHAEVMNNNRFVDMSLEGVYARAVKECGAYITSDRCGQNAYIRLRREGLVAPMFDFGSRLGAKDVGRKYEHRLLISRPVPVYDMATLFAEADAINATNNIDVAASACNVQTDDYNRFSGRVRTSGYSTASYPVMEVHLSDSATYPAFAVRDAGCNGETGVELFGQGALWLEPVSSIAGAAIKTGSIYYDSDTDDIRTYTGSSWDQVGPWDSHTELSDTAYTDMVVAPASMRIPAANSPTEVAWLTDLRAYSFADGEYLYVDGVQSPHGYKGGTDWLWHVHFCPNATELADTETVIWRLTYSVIKPFDTFPATATIDVTYTNDATARAALPVGALNGTNIKANVHLIAGSTAISGTDFTASTVLAGKMERLAADTYTGEAILVSSDFHIQVDRLGTENEYTG